MKNEKQAEDIFFTEETMDVEEFAESQREVNYSNRIYLVLVIYDISDNKRRYQMNKALEGFGVRVQRSAFECSLTNTLFNRLLKSIVKLINEDKDSLRVYKLPPGIDVKSWGTSVTQSDEDFLVF